MGEIMAQIAGRERNALRGRPLSSSAAQLWAVVLGFLAAVPAADASDPAAAPENVLTKFTNKRAFKLPVTNLNADDRAKISELRLYCRTPTSDWVVADKIAADGEFFVYRAKEDGELWFAVASVDKKGGQFPEFNKESRPNLRVIIDTVPPVLAVSVFKDPQGQTMLRCSMTAAHPDLESMRLICRDKEGTEFAVEGENNDPGLFRISPQREPVRIYGYDRCKNHTSLDLDFKDLLAGKLFQSE